MGSHVIENKEVSQRRQWWQEPFLSERRETVTAILSNRKLSGTGLPAGVTAMFSAPVVTLSRPRVRDGEAPIFEGVFRRVSELNGYHNGACESGEA